MGTASRTGEMTSEVLDQVSGGTRRPALKRGKSSDLTNYCLKKSQFNKMIKKRKIFLDIQGGRHDMNLSKKYLMTTDTTQKKNKKVEGRSKGPIFVCFSGHLVGKLGQWP